MFISSKQIIFRTDAGVHALNNAVDVDLEMKNGIPLPPHIITTRLNKTFEKWNEQLRILKSTAVRNEFDLRKMVMNRTYVYRLAVRKDNLPKGYSRKKYSAGMFIPIEEIHRCHFTV